MTGLAVCFAYYRLALKCRAQKAKNLPQATFLHAFCLLRFKSYINRPAHKRIYAYFYNIMVGMTGLEPAASWSQTKHSTKLSYIPIYVNAERRKLSVRSTAL